MKLENLIEELEKQKPLKWDKRVNSAQIEMHSAGDQGMFQIKGNGKNAFSITKPCHNQIAEKLDIPLKYYNKMESEAPDLLVENVNTWLHKTDKDFFSGD